MRNRQKVGNDIYGVKCDWKLQQRLGETAETGFRHNDHYHKYFHGYTELRIEKPNGKYRIERYYTDDWHVQDCSDREWIVQKVLMSVLALFAAIGFFWLMTRPGFEGNTSRLVAIPGLVSVPFLVLMLASTIGYAVTKRKMTWWEHHASTERISRYTIITGCLMMLTGIVMILQIFLGVTHAGAELLLAVGVMCTALAPFAMYFLEKKMRYTTQKNEVELPPGETHLIG